MDRSLVNRRARLLLRSAARRWLAPVIHALWTAQFFLARLILRPSPCTVSFNGNQRVLVIAPHPDDETLGCGSTIGNHAAAGNIVHILIATDGGKSRAHGLSTGEMVRLRAEEAKRATQQLDPNASLVLGSLPEGEWQDASMDELIRDALRVVSPSILYVPSCIDFHPEHVRVGRRVAAVLTSISPAPHMTIRVYELQVPLSLPLINLIAPVGSMSDSKEKALMEYRTQHESFTWVARQQRYLRVLFAQREPVEVFWEMSIRQYTRLMSAGGHGRSRFRSLRSNPASDGLAWLVGWRARVHLRDLSLSKRA